MPYPRNSQVLKAGEAQTLLERLPGLDDALKNGDLYLRDDGMLLVPSDFQEFCRLTWLGQPPNGPNLGPPTKKASDRIVPK